MTPHPHWTATVHHDGSARYLTPAEHRIGGSVTLRLRLGADAPCEKLFVRTCPDGEQIMTPMRRVVTDQLCQWWEASITLAAPRLAYRFLLITPHGGWWYTAAGMLRHTPPDMTDFKLLPGFAPVTWVTESVFYEIFPDRFADGDPSNNVRSGAYTMRGKPVVARAWGELPRKESSSREFFGGDLAGIIQQLDYLAGLGVTALYLTPIFVSPSSHKYDVADYTRIDPHFGGEEALQELREALDRRGMRLVLDVVPNHCGNEHAWFVEAQADASAPSAEFFTFRRHPDDYECWLGVSSLPKLNYRSPRLRELMYEGRDAVFRTWLRPPYRIDGWRLDVANMLARQGESQLGHKIGRGIRRAVKAENPQAYLLGENFFDGSPHLQGDELDATMNYRGFTMPLWQWLISPDAASIFESPHADHAPLPTEAMVAQWRSFLAAIPWQVALQQFNLLGSHDTPRILTIVGGDVDRANLAATLLFTFPGVPCIYYGDEVGLAGKGDPDCRRCMPWDRSSWNETIYQHYCTLARLRRTHSALRVGGFQLLRAAGESLAFLREDADQRVVVVARRAPDQLRELLVSHGGVLDGTRFHEVFSGEDTTVRDGLLPLENLPPVGAQVWVTEP